MSKFLSVLRIVLLVALCPLVLLTVLSAITKWVILLPKTYTSFVDNAFARSLTAMVREELEAECLFYDLPFEVLDEPLAERRVADYARRYAEAMSDTLLTGGKFVAPTVDDAVYVAAVQEFFNSLPETERPFDPQAAQTVGGELASVAQAQLMAGLDDSLLQQVHRVLSHRWLARVADWFYPFAIAVAVLVVGTVLLGRLRVRDRLYGGCFSAAIGAALAAVPLRLLNDYGLPERLALMDSPLKLYIDGMLDTLIANASRLSLIVSAVLTVLLLITIVLRSIPSKETSHS